MSRNIIQKLREKPKEAKDTIALGAAGAITFLVFIVWVATSSSRFDDVIKGSKEGMGSFSTFIGQVKEQVSAVQESIPDQIASSTAVSDLQAQINKEAAMRAASSTATSTVYSTGAREVRIATTSNSIATSSSPQLSE